MFDIEVRLTIDGRAVPFETFATQLLGQAINATIKGALADVLPTVAPGPVQRSVYPAPIQKPGSKARVVPIPVAAEILGLKPATIRAWVAGRKISSVHLGRRVMIPIDAIDKLLSEGLIPARLR
jgi:excisionase family DNA binding protein